MLNADKGQGEKLDGKKLSIGIVQARFNEGITNALAHACLHELAALGVEEKNITHVRVPGALEVPCALQKSLPTSRARHEQLTLPFLKAQP